MKHEERGPPLAPACDTRRRSRSMRRAYLPNPAAPVPGRRNPSPSGAAPPGWGGPQRSTAVSWW
jgi:hypothetical protein